MYLRKRCLLPVASFLTKKIIKVGFFRYLTKTGTKPKLEPQQPSSQVLSPIRRESVGTGRRERNRRPISIFISNSLWPPVIVQG